MNFLYRMIIYGYKRNKMMFNCFNIFCIAIMFWLPHCTPSQQAYSTVFHIALRNCIQNENLKINHLHFKSGFPV